MEFGCSANPRIGREYILSQFIPPTTEPKRVAVVGGGPAGMAGAYYAAQRGHRVTLFEKSAQLGGKLVFAKHVGFKRDLDRYLRYQLSSLERSGVELRLGTEATPAMVAAEAPDAVFAAVGSDPVIPAVDGSRLPHVIVAEECFGHLDKIGERVVVIGGGQVGCETALYLAAEGKREVTILEMRDTLAPDANFAPYLAFNDRVPKACSVLLGTRCTAIDGHSVSCADASGAKRTLAADTVVFSAGMRARTLLAESFRPCAPVFFKLGDCERAGNLHSCTRTAFDAAMQI
jgi:NADPH-dependent 2,4-dienoyl-CoA reductase/sulfur reductase-like enzyme